MFELKQAITNVADFPRPGILFRDISPLLRNHFDATVQALDALLSETEWSEVDALAGIESRGFILGAALAIRRGKGFVLVRKQGKLPPPVVDVSYELEYGSGVLEMQRGRRPPVAGRRRARHRRHDERRSRIMSTRGLSAARR
jgi:adenine phosphoribosyltransferase